MLYLLALLLPLLAAWLIGRGAGTSAFRRERVLGILFGGLIPLLFWSVVIGWQWLAPEVDEDLFRFSLYVGGVAAIALTPVCLLAAWLGNRRAVRLRRRFSRSDRFN